MMEEQGSQFAARESAPIKGYLKVETGNNKGALRCVVQNLRYFEKGDYIYKLIFFGKKGERTIHTVIGNLQVNRQGSGETYFRFLPLDADGKGNAYHQFTTAIIAAASTKDDREPLHPVLKGVTYSEVEPFQSELFQVEEEIENGQNSEIDEIISQIDKVVEDMEEALQSEETNEEHTSDDEAVSFQEEPYAEFPGNERAAAFFPKEKTVRPAPKGKTAQTGAREETVVPPKETAAAASKEVREEFVTKKNYNSFYNEYILNACAHTCRIAEFYEDVAPFERDKTGARWKKIVNITNLPLVSPGAHYFATQYRHYIFGARPDDKGVATKFYFGIPGRFLDEEQPDGGRSGFTYWQPIRGANPALESYRQGERVNRNAYGYWIVAVDGKSGNIEEV